MVENEKENWALDLQIALRIQGLMISSPRPSYKEAELYPRKKPQLAPGLIVWNGKHQIPSWGKDEVVVWILPTDTREHRIACSAIRGKNGFLITGYRHYDHHMQHLIRGSKDPDNFRQRSDVDQGFVDHLGIYHTRRQAFKIALAAGQLDKINLDVMHLLKGKKLYSEMLY